MLYAMLNSQTGRTFVATALLGCVGGGVSGGGGGEVGEDVATSACCC